MSDDRPVTQILKAIESGDDEASGRLLPLVYAELRRLATQRMTLEKQGQTLQPTALVHEAYVRLVDAREQQKWDSRGHFFAAAAEAMRRILIESARRRLAQRRKGERAEITLSNLADTDQPVNDADLLALDQALTDLEAQDVNMAAVAKLRYFAGMTVAETAELMDVSPRTVDRLWVAARAWLIRAMEA